MPDNTWRIKDNKLYLYCKECGDFVSVDEGCQHPETMKTIKEYKRNSGIE